jgi:hypothetical protein
MWIEGGDYDPADRSLVKSLAEGIRQVAPDNLQSFHGGAEAAPRSFWDDPDWLSVDSIYTYRDVAVTALDHYATQPAMPFFLIESRYEGEGASELEVRRIAYGALLSGACGQVFGNNPIWHFAGPGLYPVPLSWQDALSSRGAQSITHLRTLFDRLAWWKLKPDTAVKTADFSLGKGGAISASATDGSFALAYVWDVRTVTFRPTQLAGASGKAQWFDPSSGIFSDASGEMQENGALLFQVPSATNAAGLSDWVLLIAAAG